MRRDAVPLQALLVLCLPMAACFLSGAAPAFAAESTRIELGPLAGDLTLPPAWESAGRELATRLLKQDGVREPPVLSFVKGENQVVFATTKVLEGGTLTAAALAGGGPELARALGLAPSAIQCSAFPHPSGEFEFSICETVAKGTGLVVTGKGKQQTAAIWVDIPLAYEGPGGVTRSWTSIYFRGPGSAMASGHEVVEALLDALTLKPGLRVVAAETASAPLTAPAAPTAPTASTSPATESKRLAELLAQGLTDKPTPADVAALRDIAESYSGTVLGEVAVELARHAAARVALSTWEDLSVKSPGDAQLRPLALLFFGAALRAADIETMKATARWLADHQVNLAELQPQELTAVFPASDLCTASRRDLPKSVHDLGALDGSKNDSGRHMVDLFRNRGLAVPDVSMVAVAGPATVWKPRGDRAGVIPQVLVADGRLGSLTPKDPAKVKAGYEFKPFANIFDVLESLCRAKPAGFHN